MPTNKTLLVWLCASNVFWGVCLTLILYSTSRRDAQIAELQTKAASQEEYNEVMKSGTLAIFQLVANKIQSTDDEIEQLRKTCGAKAKVNFQ
jgi:hypothetical protein